MNNRPAFICRSSSILLVIFLWACSGGDAPAPAHWLAGSWTAPAFDGELHETWSSSGSSLVVKEGVYVENSDTLYAEQVRIDSLFNGIYLLAQPRGGNPVIFRLTDRTEGTMVFGNPANRNPFRIVYQRTDADHFVRTTYGVEQGDTVSNVFAFTRSSN